MPDTLKIAGYTIRDTARHRSFYVLLGVCLLFVMMIRGCYKGDYTVNGQTIDNLTVAWHASRIAFHAIAVGALLIATLLCMNVLSRDRTDGSAVMFLSRAVTRQSYLLGRVLGVWIVSFIFMFVLHLTIFLITLTQTGGAIKGYLLASAVCGLNLFVAVPAVSLLSLYMPDFLAAVAFLGIAGISYISDSIHSLMQSNPVQANLPEGINSAPSLWRIVWPKFSLLQQYSVSLIGEGTFRGMGPVHPCVNLLIWSALATALLVWRFDRKEL